MKKYLTIYCFALLLSLAGKEVFFVPGWRTGDSSRAGCVRIMRDIWPGYDISVKSWNSMTALADAVDNAAVKAEELKKELAAMPESRRKNLVLAGHSLGAAVVLDVLDYLAANNMTVAEAALLGTPVAADDPKLLRAVNAVYGKCFNVAFSGDTLLKFLYSFKASGLPLGVGGSKIKHPRFVDHIVKNAPDLTNHFAYKYLEALDRIK
ncbi:MAG: DUF726 domain-containing protein [Lentisphaeria bacterium]|nr:DUF726 domain-containing protein [Lentisphaeria bacterium]